MRPATFALLAVAALAVPATAQTVSEPMRLSVQSTDSTQRPEISIRLTGSLFQSLGIAEGTRGQLSLGPGGSGTATGMVVGELAVGVGELVFSVPPSGAEIEVRVWPASGTATPRLVGRGHEVRVVRDATGLRVRTGRNH